MPERMPRHIRVVIPTAGGALAEDKARERHDGQSRPVHVYRSSSEQQHPQGQQRGQCPVQPMHHAVDPRIDIVAQEAEESLHNEGGAIELREATRRAAKEERQGWEEIAHARRANELRRAVAPGDLRLAELRRAEPGLCKHDEAVHPLILCLFREG